VLYGVTAGLLAVVAGLAGGAPGTANAAPTGSSPNTWAPLAALPERLDRPLFALGVDPSDARRVLVGTPTGNLYRSIDGGATWKLAGSRLGRGVLALAFDPFTTGAVLAGTRDGGIWRSADAGASWQQDPGSEGRTARAFGFARQLTVAGTDGGVLVDRNGGAWTPAGLGQVAVSAVAVASVTDPQRLVVGGDTTRGIEPLPLFGSSDGAQSWQVVQGAVGGSSMISALVAGPVGAGSGTASLLMGTNTGLYSSADNGVDWQAVTGSGGLPAADYTAVAFVANDPQRFYVASDGGASPQGGLWSTTDGGTHFSSLSPPVTSVTALAVSAESQPVVYVATFRPIDHAVMLWAYRDTGGAAQPPVDGVPSPAGNGAVTSQVQAKPHEGPGGSGWLMSLLRGPEGPYLALGLGAAVTLVLALIAYARRTRSL
jgi:photosystem II stability/assembly factor-like uncharacterized protein